MTIIRVTCPDCGVVDINDPRQVVLHEGEKNYTFLCPGCNDMVTKGADGKVSRLLKSVGVPVEGPPPRPDPVPHPEAIPEGLPELDFNDLIDAHLHIDEELEVLFDGA